jgi:hypothetical protein
MYWPSDVPQVSILLVSSSNTSTVSKYRIKTPGETLFKCNKFNDAVVTIDSLLLVTQVTVAEVFRVHGKNNRAVQLMILQTTRPKLSE